MAFAALPRPHRRVFAARRLEVELAQGGFAGYFESPYGALAPDALEALRAFGAEEHAGLLERAMRARRLRFERRRRRELESATLAFFELDDRSPLMARRAAYIERERTAFDGVDGRLA